MALNQQAPDSAEVIRIGNCDVIPGQNLIVRDGQEISINPRTMSVLKVLIDRHGQLVSGQALLDEVWPANHVSGNTVYKAINELREAFNDNTNEPQYIETKPRKGYRLIAEIGESLPQTSTFFQTMVQPHLVLSFAAAAVTIVVLLAVLVPGDDYERQVNVASIGDKRVGLVAPETESLPEVADVMVLIYRELSMRIGQLPDTSQETVELPYVTDKLLAADLALDYLMNLEYLNGNLIVEIMPGVSGTAHVDRWESPAEDTNNAYPIDKIVNRTLEDLDTLLSSQHRERMQQWGTSSIHAYRLAYEGALRFRYFDRQHLLLAADLFQQAIEIDSKFVDAYLNLQSTYSELAYLAPNTAIQEEMRQAMLALQDNARKADLGNDVYATLENMGRMLASNNPKQLEAAWRESLFNDPNNADRLHDYAKLLSGAGLVDEARRYTDLAIKNANPDDAEAIRLMGYGNIAGATDIAELVPIQRKLLELYPNYTLVLFSLVEGSATLGNYIEAERYLYQLKRSDTEGSWAYAAQLSLQAIRGDFSEDNKALEAALAHPQVTNMIRGKIFFRLNRVEEGIEAWRHMEPAFVHHLWQHISAMELIMDQRVLADPGYQALLEEFGLGNRWRGYLLQRTSQLTAATGIPVTTPFEPAELYFVSTAGRRNNPGEELLSAGGEI